MKSHKKKIEVLFCPEAESINKKLETIVWAMLFHRLVCGTRIVVDVRGYLSDQIAKR
jgi:hypothetical protein